MDYFLFEPADLGARRSTYRGLTRVEGYCHAPILDILTSQRGISLGSAILYIRESVKRLFALLWIAVPMLPSVSAAAESPHTVVVLYSDDRFLPANIEGDRGLRAVIENAGGGRVELFDEHLDHLHFDGSPNYERTISNYLRDKYASRPPAIIVVAGDEALDFILRN